MGNSSTRNPRRKVLSAVALLVAGLSSGAQAADTPGGAPTPTTVIYAGWLLATPGSAPLHEQTIVIREGVVQSVMAGYRSPDSFGAPVKVVDLKNRYLLPGLLDLHVHLSMDVTVPENQWSQLRARPAATLAFEAARGAEHMLRSGFTTVRDVGGPVNVVFPLRDAVAAGLIPGPRILAAGPIISRTGGHGQSYCDGIESCRRLTRERISLEGADIIKIATGGGGGDATSAGGGEADMFPDEIEAVTGSARQLNRFVAAHAHSTAAINAALRGGVHTIEHGTHFDDTSVKLFKEKGAFLVPTVYVVDFLEGNPTIRNGLSVERWQHLSAALKDTRAVPGRAYRAGVRMALGTDSGNELTSKPARELQLYVESGVPAGEAIKAATLNAAEAIGLGNTIGQVKAGFAADLIAADADPLENVAHLFPAHISFVMKGGRIYKLRTKGAAPCDALEACESKTSSDVSTQ